MSAIPDPDFDAKSTHVAFVAGATGYTGREVVRQLAEAGVTVVAHVRPDSERRHDWRRRFEKIGAQVDETAWEAEAMTKTMNRIQPTLIFALLGTTRARKAAVAKAGGDPEAQTYEAVDYGLTSLLLQACLAAHVTPKFVYLSAVGVSEKSRDAYSKVRWRFETELRHSGLPFVVARPSFIVGEGRDTPRPMEHLGATLIDGATVVIGLLGAKTWSRRLRSMDNVELAEGLVRYALDQSAVNVVIESEGLRRDANRG
ncbi:MAG: NAD(P)H-binding protein [Deltaproteobacteria bacterium]|nr:NAD(P)H-binding protein [Deltaproteobacteria bacterium]MCB9490006.1 NAD(P)H-binding protein [Deltaproteobacteria bacterium]